MDPLKAKANFSRVCQLLVDKGSDALRAVLHAIHPPATLAAVLKANESALQKIRRSVITNQQWDLLFPTSPGAAPDSKKFDITLLTILLTNICGLSPPTRGWNKIPSTGDTSKPADIVRIKIFRNEIYGHIASAQLDDARFEKLWQEISQSLVRLGIPKKDMDEIKVAPLSPQEESYIQQLKEWKQRDYNILSELIHKVDNLQMTVENFRAPERKPQEKKPTSCLPDRLPMFTGCETEVQNVIAFLMDRNKAVVSLRGGPGFGKTAIAIEVSHKLSEAHTILVVFSQLAAATNEDEMIRQLCLNIGVNHEDDPKQSLMLWLKNIEMKVILVMDDIDNLLEEARSVFDDFIRLLRTNSNCQLITTSRTCYLIPGLTIGKVDVGEIKGKSRMELLKKQCPQYDEKFLHRLGELCGNIPLAMCIAGSLVDNYEDPDELLQHLQKQPMKTLECPESNRYVNRAIDLSYKKFSDEEKETMVRLSVFEGSFSEDAAKEVIEKDRLDASRILHKLVSRSLIKKQTQRRYSIHLSIRHFLKDKQASGGEKAQKAREEAIRARLLMIKHYLELGHELTMNSYSKDGYKDNREALEREAPNILGVLKICCQQQNATRSDISDCLASTKIYTTSARLFSYFIRSIIPRYILEEFLQRCANLAKERKQHAIRINFLCLLAAETIGESDEYFVSTIEKMKKEFETHHENLKEDKLLCAHFYYQYGTYLSHKSESHQGKERLRLQIEAREKLKKSLELGETLTSTPEGMANKIFSSMKLGNVCKFIYSSELYQKKTKEVAFRDAEKYYNEAIELSKASLGKHLLTSWCHKNFEDLYFTTNRKLDQAEIMYKFAKNMFEKLGLHASEGYVFLLNNLGKCLKESKRTGEAITVLESARVIAEKLSESDDPTVCKTKVYTSLAIAYDLVHMKSEAVYYASKALEFDQMEIVIKKYEHEKLQGILQICAWGQLY